MQGRVQGFSVSGISKQVKICYGDVVELHDSRIGQVSFVGPPTMKTEIWYGITLRDPTGHHNGCVRGRTFWNCKAKHGDFFRKENIKKVVKARVSFPRITVFSEVALKRGKRGSVKFVGRVHFDHGIYYGVEVLSGMGSNSGSMGGVHYFHTASFKGLFLPEKAILDAMFSNAPSRDLPSLPTKRTPKKKPSRKTGDDSSDEDSDSSSDEDFEPPRSRVVPRKDRESFAVLVHRCKFFSFVFSYFRFFSVYM